MGNINGSSGEILIRPVNEGDLADLFEIYGDEETSRYLLNDAWTKENRQEEFEKRLNNGALWLAVVKENKVIGTLSVFTKEMKDTYEIGYVFHKDYRHRGYAYNSLMKLVRYLFEERKAHRLYAELDARNTDSIRLLERCGFVKEAYFRKDCFSKGEWTDTLVYALLETDEYQ